jgi:hypothetical protein
MIAYFLKVGPYESSMPHSGHSRPRRVDSSRSVSGDCRGAASGQYRAMSSDIGRHKAAVRFMRDGNPRWFAEDELDALGAINGLPDTLVPPAPLEICDSYRGRVRRPAA